jgi:FixJ family two-component response regulator
MPTAAARYSASRCHASLLEPSCRALTVSRGPNMRQNPRVVAVVEDDAPSRQALGRLLRSEGFEPLLFESAEAYIDAAPAAACLIVDVRLPGMSGLDLQRTLLHAKANVPVIVTTGTRDAVIRTRAEQDGCAAFFWKPLDSDALVATLSLIAAPSRD